MSIDVDIDKTMWYHSKEETSKSINSKDFSIDE